MWPLKWDDYIFAFAQKLLQLKSCSQNYKAENYYYRKSYFVLQKMCNENHISILNFKHSKCNFYGGKFAFSLNPSLQPLPDTCQMAAETGCNKMSFWQ